MPMTASYGAHPGSSARSSPRRAAVPASYPAAHDHRAGRAAVTRSLALLEAPFHRAENSVADAVLVETHRAVTAGALAGPADHYGSVVQTIEDSSDPRDHRSLTRTCRTASLARTPAVSSASKIGRAHV